MNTPEQTIELVKKFLNDHESVSVEELDKLCYECHDIASADFCEIARTAYCAAYSAIDIKRQMKKYEKLAQKEG